MPNIEDIEYEEQETKQKILQSQEDYVEGSEEVNPEEEVMRLKEEEEIPAGFYATHEKAKVPARATQGCAGYDLYSIQMGILPPGERLLIRTGISWVMPNGFVGEIKPRSGLAVDFGLDVLAGVVDADYRGEIKVLLINHGKECFYFNEGDRIAQLVIKPTVHFVGDQSTTIRGEDGFGSSGV